jgi:hypothetical protein
MRGLVSPVPWGRTEATYAVVIPALVVGLALLFIFPAPTLNIQAQGRIEGL